MRERRRSGQSEFYQASVLRSEVWYIWIWFEGREVASFLEVGEQFMVAEEYKVALCLSLSPLEKSISRGVVVT